MSEGWRWGLVLVGSTAVLVTPLLVGAVARARALNRVVADRGTAFAGPMIAPPTLLRWAAPPPAWFGRRLVLLDLAVDPVRLWARAMLVVPLGVLLGAVLVGPALALVVAASTAGAVAAAVGAAGDRAGRRVDRELPLLVDDLAGALRTGRSLPDAIRHRGASTTGPLAADLRAVAAWLDAGVPLGDALERWRSRRPSAAVRLVVTALALATGLGGGTAPLDGVASTLRDRRAIDHEVRAASAQARASAVVLVATPFAFLALSSAYDPRALTFLTATPVGLACLGIGVALDLAGGAWMARTIGSAT